MASNVTIALNPKLARIIRQAEESKAEEEGKSETQNSCGTCYRDATHTYTFFSNR